MFTPGFVSVVSYSRCTPARERWGRGGMGDWGGERTIAEAGRRGGRPYLHMFTPCMLQEIVAFVAAVVVVVVG